MARRQWPTAISNQSALDSTTAAGLVRRLKPEATERFLTCHMTTNPTIPISTPDMLCSAPLQLSKQPCFQPNLSSHEGTFSFPCGNGNALSTLLWSPQHLNVSCMVLIASPSLARYKDSQRSLRPQRRLDVGPVCVPRRVMTTVEYTRMSTLAMIVYKAAGGGLGTGLLRLERRWVRS